MVPYRSTALLFTCVISSSMASLLLASGRGTAVSCPYSPDAPEGDRSCLGFVPSPARGFDRLNQIETGWTTAALPATKRPSIGPGDTGPEVKELQKTLKGLGYYDGVEDGVWGEATAAAIAKFQKSVGLQADSVVDSATWEQLAIAVERQKNADSTTSQTPSNLKSKISVLLKGKLRWIFLGVGAVVLVAIVGGLFNLLWRSSEKEENSESPTPARRPRSSENLNPDNSQPNCDLNGFENSDGLALKETTRLPKSHIIDELIKNLQQTDPAKRRQAIWELGRRGDSRAVQPLVNLTLDSDSKQRSLILAALSEIGTRTLAPMNRALAVSLQDENAEVRKNAIRDLTRIYEIVCQTSHLLHHAVDDPDPEVRETARWALSQLSQIRLPPGMENRHSWQNSTNLSEESGDK